VIYCRYETGPGTKRCGETVLNVVEMYDTADGKWGPGLPMPTPRHPEAVATVGNTVYAIGGVKRPTHEGPIATVDALDCK
jgi:serine/threonine-protein kinase PknK